MKKIISSLCVAFMVLSAQATVYTVQVWDGYFQFVNPSTANPLILQLGDTIQWLPLDFPSMAHTVTASNIPSGATSFDYLWQAPADTFFQYIPSVVGVYDYVCTPHEFSHGMIGSFEVQDSIVGIKNNFYKKELIIAFPNPVTDIVSFDAQLNQTNYMIFDLQGKEILKGKLEGFINVSNLPKGIFIIEFLVDEPKYAKFTKD